jgi:NADH:ubiquinone oxidoreductase subunit K
MTMEPDLVRHALVLSVLLFAIGVVGVFLRRNLITVSRSTPRCWCSSC